MNSSIFSLKLTSSTTSCSDTSSSITDQRLSTKNKHIDTSLRRAPKFNDITTPKAENDKILKLNVKNTSYDVTTLQQATKCNSDVITTLSNARKSLELNNINCTYGFTASEEAPKLNADVRTITSTASKGLKFNRNNYDHVSIASQQAPTMNSDSTTASNSRSVKLNIKRNIRSSYRVATSANASPNETAASVCSGSGGGGLHEAESTAALQHPVTQIREAAATSVSWSRRSCLGTERHSVLPPSTSSVSSGSLHSVVGSRTLDVLTHKVEASTSVACCQHSSLGTQSDSVLQPSTATISSSIGKHCGMETQRCSIGSQQCRSSKTLYCGSSSQNCSTNSDQSSISVHCNKEIQHYSSSSQHCNNSQHCSSSLQHCNGSRSENYNNNVRQHFNGISERSNNRSEHYSRTRSQHFTSSSHCVAVLQRLQQQQEQLCYCDVILQIRGVCIEAHRCVLAACSPYFSSLFKRKQVVKERVRLNIPNASTGDVSALRLFLVYAYTGSVTVTSEGVMHLLRVADHLQVLQLKSFCSEFLSSDLGVGNCLCIKDLASRYGLRGLHATACQLLHDNIVQVLTASEVLSLPIKTLEALVQQQFKNSKSSNLSNVGCAVLVCVIRWLVSNTIPTDKSSAASASYATGDAIAQQYWEMTLGDPLPTCVKRASCGIGAQDYSASTKATDTTTGAGSTNTASALSGDSSNRVVLGNAAPSLLTFVPWKHVSARLASSVVRVLVSSLGGTHELVQQLATTCHWHHLLHPALHQLLLPHPRQQELEEVIDAASFNDLAIRAAIDNINSHSIVPARSTSTSTTTTTAAPTAVASVAHYPPSHDGERVLLRTPPVSKTSTQHSPRQRFVGDRGEDERFRTCYETNRSDQERVSQKQLETAETTKMLVKSIAAITTSSVAAATTIKIPLAEFVDHNSGENNCSTSNTHNTANDRFDTEGATEMEHVMSNCGRKVTDNNQEIRGVERCRVSRLASSVLECYSKYSRRKYEPADDNIGIYKGYDSAGETLYADVNDSNEVCLQSRCASPRRQYGNLSVNHSNDDNSTGSAEACHGLQEMSACSMQIAHKSGASEVKPGNKQMLCSSYSSVPINCSVDTSSAAVGTSITGSTVTINSYTNLDETDDGHSRPLPSVYTVHERFRLLKQNEQCSYDTNSVHGSHFDSSHNGGQNFLFPPGSPQSKDFVAEHCEQEPSNTCHDVELHHGNVLDRFVDSHPCDDSNPNHEWMQNRNAFPYEISMCHDNETCDSRIESHNETEYVSTSYEMLPLKKQRFYQVIPKVSFGFQSKPEESLEPEERPYHLKLPLKSLEEYVCYERNCSHAGQGNVSNDCRLQNKFTLPSDNSTDYDSNTCFATTSAPNNSVTLATSFINSINPVASMAAEHSFEIFGKIANQQQEPNGVNRKRFSGDVVVAYNSEEIASDDTRASFNHPKDLSVRQNSSAYLQANPSCSNSQSNDDLHPTKVQSDLEFKLHAQQPQLHPKIIDQIQSQKLELHLHHNESQYYSKTGKSSLPSCSILDPTDDSTVDQLDVIGDESEEVDADGNSGRETSYQKLSHISDCLPPKLAYKIKDGSTNIGVQQYCSEWLFPQPRPRHSSIIEQYQPTPQQQQLSDITGRHTECGHDRIHFDERFCLFSNENKQIDELDQEENELVVEDDGDFEAVANQNESLMTVSHSHKPRLSNYQGSEYERDSNRTTANPNMPSTTGYRTHTSEQESDDNCSFERSNVKEFLNNSSLVHAEDLLTTPEKVLCNTGLSYKPEASFTSAANEELKRSSHGKNDANIVAASTVKFNESTDNFVYSRIETHVEPIFVGGAVRSEDDFDYQNTIQNVKFKFFKNKRNSNYDSNNEENSCQSKRFKYGINDNHMSTSGKISSRIPQTDTGDNLDDFEEHKDKENVLMDIRLDDDKSPPHVNSSKIYDRYVARRKARYKITHGIRTRVSYTEDNLNTTDDAVARGTCSNEDRESPSDIIGTTTEGFAFEKSGIGVGNCFRASHDSIAFARTPRNSDMLHSDEQFLFSHTEKQNYLEDNIVSGEEHERNHSSSFEERLCKSEQPPPVLQERSRDVHHLQVCGDIQREDLLVKPPPSLYPSSKTFPTFSKVATITTSCSILTTSLKKPTTSHYSTPGQYPNDTSLATIKTFDLIRPTTGDAKVNSKLSWHFNIRERSHEDVNIKSEFFVNSEAVNEDNSNEQLEEKFNTHNMGKLSEEMSESVETLRNVELGNNNKTSERLSSSELLSVVKKTKKYRRNDTEEKDMNTTTTSERQLQGSTSTTKLITLSTETKSSNKCDFTTTTTTITTTCKTTGNTAAAASLEIANECNNNTRSEALSRAAKNELFNEAAPSKTTTETYDSVINTPANDDDDDINDDVTADIASTVVDSKCKKPPEIRTCDQCKQEFTKKQYFKHMKQRHFPGPPYQCELCNHKFGKIYHLLEHRQTHQDSRLYSCEQCSFSAHKKANLNAHIKTAHENLKPFKCRKCELRFPRKQQLAVHESTHSSDRPHVCYCGFTAKTRTDLVQHTRKHTGNMFTCTFEKCSYSTAKKTHFTEHLRSHSDAREFVCTVCGKQYRTRSYLRKHARSHLGLKPFACEHCDYRTSRKDSLKLHMSKVHLSLGGGKPSNCKRNRRTRTQHLKHQSTDGHPSVTESSDTPQTAVTRSVNSNVGNSGLCTVTNDSNTRSQFVAAAAADGNADGNDFTVAGNSVTQFVATLTVDSNANGTEFTVVGNCVTQFVAARTSDGNSTANEFTAASNSGTQLVATLTGSSNPVNSSAFTVHSDNNTQSFDSHASNSDPNGGNVVNVATDDSTDGIVDRKGETNICAAVNDTKSFVSCENSGSSTCRRAAIDGRDTVAGTLSVARKNNSSSCNISNNNFNSDNSDGNNIRDFVISNNSSNRECIVSNENRNFVRKNDGDFVSNNGNRDFVGNNSGNNDISNFTNNLTTNNSSSSISNNATEGFSSSQGPTFVQTIENGTRIECSQAELFSEMDGSATNYSLQPQVSGSPPNISFSDYSNTGLQDTDHYPTIPPTTSLATALLDANDSSSSRNTGVDSSNSSNVVPMHHSWQGFIVEPHDAADGEESCTLAAYPQPHDNKFLEAPGCTQGKFISGKYIGTKFPEPRSFIVESNDATNEACTLATYPPSQDHKFFGESAGCSQEELLPRKYSETKFSEPRSFRIESSDAESGTLAAYPQSLSHETNFLEVRGSEENLLHVKYARTKFPETRPTQEEFIEEKSSAHQSPETKFSKTKYFAEK